MKIKRFVGGSLQSNGYIISKKDGGSCYIIDPGYEPDRFVRYTRENRLDPKGVILTHHHHDHTGGAAKTADELGCPVMMSFEDSLMYRGEVDLFLSGGQYLELDGEKLLIQMTPGHTKGSLCIIGEKSRAVFSGDTIFDTDLGRTDLSDGSLADMMRSCAEVINMWPDDYMVYPGHDGSASMKMIRKYNTEFLQMLKEYGK